MTKKCIICGLDFKMYQRKGYFYVGKTCSRECFYISSRKSIQVDCSYCGNKMTMKPYRFRAITSGIFCCSKDCRTKHNRENKELYFKKTVKECDIPKIIKLYTDDFKKLNEVAVFFNITVYAVKCILAKNNIKIRRQSDYRSAPKSFTSIAKRLLAEMGDMCQRCGWGNGRCDVHHIIPRSKGGTNEKQNLVILCPNCHRIEHDKLKSSK
mgnify:FL=1